jgi:hypothetical protein
MKLLATALACLAAACGIAAAGSPPATEAPPTIAEFAITYERSGGLKPMPYRLAIRPGRAATLTAEGALDERSRTVRFRVSRKRIRRLRAALGRAGFETVGDPGPSPGACADCYFYAIAYEGHEVTFSEALVPKRLRETVALLEDLIAAHLPRH